MKQGKSIRIFLADGTPGGLLTAEIGNWTGHVLAVSRTELPQLLKRPEAGNTGVYILIGDDPEVAGGELGYIGEAEGISSRLPAHVRPGSSGGKDFWERAIVVISKDANFTKAHAKYVESRFIQLARDANRVRLTNLSSPPLPSLPESDVSDMEYFIAQAQIVLPVLGVNILRGSTSPKNADGSRPTLVAKGSGEFVLNYPKEGISARARVSEGEFTVLEGSQAKAGWPVLKSHLGYNALKARLEADGTLVPDASTGHLVFARDQVFSSPSAAAAVIYARAANGRTKWRVELTGQTFGEWQANGMELPAYKPEEVLESYEIEEDESGGA